MKIRVPATSANLGPGFDSCGLALTLYLTIAIVSTSEAWRIDHELGKEIPDDKNNLIIQTALNLVPELKPHHLKMTCDIPAARGLGSSSAAIIAGIELANYLGKLNLSKEHKVTLAAKIEGHPDNVAPAVFGNFVVGAKLDEADFYVRHLFPTCEIIAYIPDHELLTSESRAVLPENLFYQEAVKASAISNVLIAAILQNDMPLAGEMMERDMWHERYRAKLIPDLQHIRSLTKSLGAYAACLSGAGPTILIFSSRTVADTIVEKLQIEYGQQGKIIKLGVEGSGSEVLND
ncbi:homoserine kinase [Listeria sp. PSOL-1]|uniref:homoserine kinase n=1 Tax=Listeria sp. PSOL-1 TaxID=1844999 RepID=UPI0013D7173A|nr:homoserine kinase [Listeria sp. PSOL-1]